jgi:CheY-like chemotaxis protein
MDLMMPEMDGLTATRNIRERQKDPAAHPNYSGRILIIAMTAHAQQSDKENASPPAWTIIWPSRSARRMCAA